MTELAVRGWRLEVDVGRTKKTYSEIGVGGWQRCGCVHCRNFGLVVKSAFPPDILRFFAEAGIEPQVDAEIYEMGATGEGRRFYAGEYYAWAEVLHDPANVPVEGQPFRFTFMEPTPLRQVEFSGPGSVCFYFEAELPWVLSESPDA